MVRLLKKGEDLGMVRGMEGIGYEFVAERVKERDGNGREKRGRGTDGRGRMELDGRDGMESGDEGKGMDSRGSGKEKEVGIEGRMLIGERVIIEGGVGCGEEVRVEGGVRKR